MVFILMLVLLLVVINSLIMINDLEKRFTNSISYIEILKANGKIDRYEAIKLMNVMKGD